MDTQYLKELFGLEGKVAVVTGGGGVLCSTMSRALGRMGVQCGCSGHFTRCRAKSRR